MRKNPLIGLWLEQLRQYRSVALDTNLIIYALEGVAPYDEMALHLFRLMERGILQGVASTIVEAETLVKPIRNRDRLAIDKIELFFRNLPNLLVKPVDSGLARTAARVRADNRLTLFDAVIVATALEQGCDAIIGNDRLMGQRVTGIPYVYLENYLI